MLRSAGQRPAVSVLARIALEANFVGFVTIALKRVIGMVLLFGFYFGLINFITLNY